MGDDTENGTEIRTDTVVPFPVDTSVRPDTLRDPAAGIITIDTAGIAPKNDTVPRRRRAPERNAPVSGGDSLAPPADSLPEGGLFPGPTLPATPDSTRSDSVNSKPLFKDVVEYYGKDSLHFSITDKKIYLYGPGSYVKYLTTELYAGYIMLDMEKKEAYATGIADSLGNTTEDPDFKDGGQAFKSKELRYNFESQKGLITKIITEQGEGYMQGQTTKKLNDSIYCVVHGFYTTCDCHDHPHFGIRAPKIKMIQKHRAFAVWPQLELEGVPLPLTIPFIFFPITDKGSAGILMPTYGEERVRGFNLRNGGYYFLIGDYADMAITGDIYSNGSWGLRLASRYILRYKFTGNLDFSINRSYAGEKGLPDYTESKDWSVRWTHSQDAKANPYTSFSASVDMSSASNNQYNYTSLNDLANQRKQSSISWSKKWPDSPFSINGSFNHSQTSKDTTISLTLPRFSVKMSQIYPFRKKGKGGDLKWYDNIGISYSGELTNSISNVKEYDLKNQSFSKDWKNGYKHSIPVSFSFKISDNITFSPSLSYTGNLNLKTIEKIWVPDTSATGGSVVTRHISGLNYSHQYSTSASISFSPKIYGMYTYKPGSRIKALRHVISPTLSFSYTPPIGPLGDYTKTYFNGEKEVEYSIYDGMVYQPTTTRSKQSGNISLGIDNNLEMKKRSVVRDSTASEEEDEKDEKIKILESFSIRASYNIFADSMRFSTISLSARTKVLRDKVDLNFSGTLDPYALDANGRKINKYHGGIGRLTQASLSTSFGISPQQGGGSTAEEGSAGEKAAGTSAYQGYFDRYATISIPWSLNTSYSLNYSKSGLSKANITQVLNVSGNATLGKWSLSASSGYDITNKQISSTSLNISRDLHCWEMNFECIPFGKHQSFSFRINVKASMLKDLKYNKRQSWYDK